MFLSFKAYACSEDGNREADGFSDSGHNCPLKNPSDNPEFRWLLAFAKAFTYLGGRQGSYCHELLYGNMSHSACKYPTVARSRVLPAIENMQVKYAEENYEVVNYI